MRRLAASALKAGTGVQANLYRADGEKLLSGGTRLTEGTVRMLRSLMDETFYEAESLEELEDIGLLAPLPDAELVDGEPSRATIVSLWGRKLLTPGEPVEPHHLRALREGGFCVSEGGETSHLRVEQAFDRIVTTKLRLAELKRAFGGRSGRVSPASASIWETADKPRARPTWPTEVELAEWRQRELAELEDWLARLLAGEPLSSEPIEAMVGRLYEWLLGFPERFTQLALLNRRRDEHLADQGYAVAVLAMATAAQLNWPEQAVRQVGMAGLIADAGMMLMPRHLRQGVGRLNSSDQKCIERHPAYSVAMLHDVPGIAAEVRWAVYQHHEREGAIGYPEMRRGESICDVARVLALADTFAAATAPRYHRGAKLPYHVMEQIIRSAASGVFDKAATRGLVQAAGLFPVGSYVELIDGRRAYVVAVHAERLDRPVVRLLDEANQPLDEVVDLAQVPPEKLKIARAVREAPASAAA